MNVSEIIQRFNYTKQDYKITKNIKIKGFASVKKGRLSKLHLINNKYIKLYGRMGKDITLNLEEFCYV